MITTVNSVHYLRLLELRERPFKTVVLNGLFVSSDDFIQVLKIKGFN